MKIESKPFQWKPFSPKCLACMANTEAWLNILVGSIRSAKTITAIVIFIDYMIRSSNTDFMMVGKTLGTLERNVLKPLLSIFKSLGVHADYNGYTHEVTFLDNIISLFGAGKMGDDEKIQGSTFGGAFIDEATVIHEDAFKMILSRNSLPESQIFLTCNPANPNHYIYTEYIQNNTLQKQGKCTVWTFTLEDNYALDSAYVENLKASYSEDSLFYKRYILGEWVSGNGAIYPNIDDDNLYSSDVSLDGYDYIAMGSDYGASSTTCWTLIGITEHETYNTYDIIDEGGYNAEEEGISITDEEVVELILETQEKWNLGEETTFYVSHDATSLETSLLKNPHIRLTIDKFTPDVMKSITTINSLFYQNHLRIHTRCAETLKSLQSYEWDSNASRRGEDKPRKVGDHYADAVRAPIMNHLFDDEDMGFIIEV